MKNQNTAPIVPTLTPATVVPGGFTLGCIRMFDSITQGYVIQELLTELPSIVACIGGIVLAVTLWRRAPRSSLYVVLACGLTLLLLLAYPIVWQIVRHIFGDLCKTLLNGRRECKSE